MYLVFPESTAIPEVGFKEWTGKTSAAAVRYEAGLAADAPYRPRLLRPACGRALAKVITGCGSGMPGLSARANICSEVPEADQSVDFSISLDFRGTDSSNA